MLYRIFTENVPANRSEVERTVSKYFGGYTVFDSVGYWNGRKENSLCIEVVTDIEPANIKKLVKKLAEDIRVVNNQEAVLVQKLEVETFLIN